MDLFLTFSNNDIQHNDTQHKGRICDTQHDNTAIMLRVIMLDVIMLSVVGPILAM